MKQQREDESYASCSMPRRRSTSCCQSIVAYENAMCATRTAWGYLDESSTGWLGLWWLMRHAIYFGLSALLLIFVAGSSSFFVVVPFMMHYSAHVQGDSRVLL
jgi:hypothetical protein